MPCCVPRPLRLQVTAKKLFRRLEGLGARPLVPLGLGNDQHPAGYEAALDPWALSMWPVVRQVCLPCARVGSLAGAWRALSGWQVHAYTLHTLCGRR